MRRIFLILIWVVSSYALSMAENVDGYVRSSSSNEPIEFASIFAVMAGDSTLVSTAYSDIDGYFNLDMPDQINLDQIFLNIQALGFRQLRDIKLPTISNVFLLDEATYTLNEIVVSSTKKAYKISGNKLIFEPSSLGHLEAKKAPDILQYVPKVSFFDNEYYIGKTPAVVYINDRRLNESEVNSYLQSLDADNISKIEIQDMRSSELSGDITGGIIRIVTKTKPLGLNCNAGINLGAFKMGYYTISPNTSFYLGKDNWNIYGSYAFNNSKRGQENSAYSVYPDETIYSSKGNGTYYDQHHSFKLGSYAEFASHHSISIECSGNYAHNPKSIIDVNNFETLDSKHIVDESGIFRSNVNYSVFFMSGAAQYVYKIDDNGSLIKALGVYNHNRSESQNYMTTTYQDDITNSQDDYSNATGDNYSFYLDYKQNFGNWNIESGLSCNYTKRSSSIEVHMSDLSSSNWISHENILSGYVNSYYKFSDIIACNVGLRMEKTSLIGDIGENSDMGEMNIQRISSLYYDWLPYAYLSGSLPGNIRYGIGYTRSLYRPPFRLLTNYANKVSDWLYDIGNPNLKREIRDDIELTLDYKSHSFSIEYNRINDPITELFEEIDGIVYHSNQNIGYSEAVAFVYGFNKRVVSWWLVNANLAAEYTHSPYCYLKHNAWNGIFSLSNQFSFDRIGAFSISARGDTGSITGNSIRSGYYTINAGYTYYGTNWSVSLGINDIFNSIKTKTRNFNPTLDYTAEIKNMTRQFFINFT